jgi:hypothetical protein
MVVSFVEAEPLVRVHGGRSRFLLLDIGREEGREGGR